MTKKLSLLVLAASAASAALAQTPPAGTPGVQLYGVVDAGVESIRNVGAANGSVTRMPSLSGGQLPSRWGMRGNEDLGGGLGAVFTLEAGFGVDNGQPLQGGRAFGRQAFVGLTGDWGTLTAGRHWTMTFYSMLDADVMGPSAFGLAAFDAYLPNARADNSVSYLGKFNGFTAGGTYSLGRDASAPSNCAGEAANADCRAWSLMGKYDAAQWGVALAHDRLGGSPTAGFFGQPAGTLASAANTDQRTLLNGYLKLGATKVGAGWIRRRLDVRPTALATDIYFVGARFPVADVVSVDAQLIALRDARASAGAQMALVRGNYAFSRRTSAYLMLGHVRNDQNAAYSITAGEAVSAAPAAGRSQSGVMVGLRHSF